MYEVSSEFFSEMLKPAQKRTIRGTIDGIPFTAKNIVKGSCSITNQCSDNNNIQIGQVYIGQLKITLRDMRDIPRKTYKGREIILYQGLYIGNAVQEVLLGHWFVDDATWTTSGVVIVAYDAMSKFDKTSSSFPKEGTMYSYITLACSACNVELGMSIQDFIDISAVNMRFSYSMYQDNDIETWRDVLSWVSQTIGCNATINRQGKLVFRSYNHVFPVDDFDSKRRLSGGSFSDFDTYYTGISVVNIVNQTTSYYGLPVDDGLTMNLGSNPFLQESSFPGIDEERRNVLDSIAFINFTPCKVRLNALMIYDLMDVISFSGGIVGDEEPINTCITKFTWNLNGDYTIECSGSDPGLASARSKTDKNIAGLLSQLDENEIQYYDFVNANRITIRDGHENRKRIVNIRYGVKKDTHIDFHAEIMYNLSTVEMSMQDSYVENDGKIKVTYYVDDDEVREYHPMETNTDGVHLLHLLYSWKGLENTTGRFSIFLEAEDCDITIDVASCRGFISGQGLLGTEEWDGYINAEDNVQLLRYIDGVRLTRDTSNVNTQIPMPATSNDRVGLLGYVDSVGIISDGVSGMIGMIFTTVVNLSLLTYTATISNNTFTNGEVITPAMYDVEQIRVTSNGVAYYVSVDGGITWSAWVEGQWVEGASMTASELESVPTSALQGRIIKVRAVIDSQSSLTIINVKGGHI
jgi:hypothetical protein